MYVAWHPHASVQILFIFWISSCELKSRFKTWISWKMVASCTCSIPLKKTRDYLFWRLWIHHGKLVQNRVSANPGLTLIDTYRFSWYSFQVVFQAIIFLICLMFPELSLIILRLTDIILSNKIDTFLLHWQWPHNLYPLSLFPIIQSHSFISQNTFSNAGAWGAMLEMI